MRLFHVSDNPDIGIFEPRPVKIDSYDVDGNAVWAIDEAHLPNYLLPRDCPRVCILKVPRTTEDDIQQFFGDSGAGIIIYVEKYWMERIDSQTLYIYEFDGDDFRLIDGNAGYYISDHPVVPLRMSSVEDLPGELKKFDVELRALGSLWDIREDVIASTLGYSIIRMRNASPPVNAIKKYHPLP
jgi:hypothetical protein